MQQPVSTDSPSSAINQQRRPKGLVKQEFRFLCLQVVGGSRDAKQDVIVTSWISMEGPTAPRSAARRIQPANCGLISHIFSAEQVCMLKSLWGKCLLVPTDKPNLLSPSNTDFWNVPNRTEQEAEWAHYAEDLLHFLQGSKVFLFINPRVLT